MKGTVETLQLDLETRFTISRGSQATVETAVVRLSDGERAGVGAAAPARRYGETPDTVAAVLPELLDAVESVAPENLARVDTRLRETVRKNPAARAAVEIAAHDLAATRAGLPLYRFLGLDPAAAPRSSYTVGIDDPDGMAESAAAAVAAGHRILKVKVGTGDDAARLGAVREAAPDATLRVDANEAWSPREALREIESLAAFDVEFVEQPVPGEDLAGLRFVRERSPVPVAADEAVETPTDVPAVADAADIVVLKVMKAGGVRATRRAAHAAKAHGLEVMLGCMIESNASIAASAHLAPLADYADLDGSLLLADDPFEGVRIDGDGVHLADCDHPGTGAVESDGTDADAGGTGADG
jgi:L-alanine-DL-glutamate epimerase-like enolase superfamily enzyme